MAITEFHSILLIYSKYKTFYFNSSFFPRYLIIAYFYFFVIIRQINKFTHEHINRSPLLSSINLFVGTVRISRRREKVWIPVSYEERKKYLFPIHKLNSNGICLQNTHLFSIDFNFGERIILLFLYSYTVFWPSYGRCVRENAYVYITSGSKPSSRLKSNLNTVASYVLCCSVTAQRNIKWYYVIWTNFRELLRS